MPRGQQLLLALVFLTRLPLGRFLPDRVLPLSDSLWAFPIVGALIGAIAGLPLLLDGPSLLLAVISVGLSVWLTGALHEDALADFSDAGGGKDRQSRLQIMRDSHIGSYGVMALILSTALRITALAVLGPVALIASTTCGRTAIVLAMAALPPARRDGLGHAAGKPSAATVWIVILIAIMALLPLGWPACLAALAGLAALALVIRQARHWLGGQTGDVLGTASIVSETAILVAFALLLS